MAINPGVRLGQRGGLYDLYQYYLGGGDEQTEAPVSTVNTTQFIQPVSGGQGDGQVSQTGTFDNYTPDYSAEGMARGAGNTPFNFIDKGVQNFNRTFRPDSYYQYDGPYDENDEGTVYDFDKKEANFFSKARDGIGSFFRNIPTPSNLLSKLGRPDNAIYSYGGDATGFGSRAGLTPEELRAAQLLEQYGGTGDGKDVFGINYVSAFGDYDAYAEKTAESTNQDLKNLESKYNATWDEELGEFTGPGAELANQMTKNLRLRNKTYTGFTTDLNQRKSDDLAKKIDSFEKYTRPLTSRPNYIAPTTVLGQKDLGEITADGPGITSTITTPSGGDYRDAGVGGPAGQGTIGGGVASAGNTAPSTSRGPAGGATTGGGGGGGAAAGMGGGSQQATSAGSTNSGRSDGGWGWKDGGLVTRKPYGNGGIVDLL